MIGLIYIKIFPGREMMNIRGGTIAAMLLAFVVSGCGTMLDKAQSVTPSGNAFSSSLHYYYTQRAAAEQSEANYREADRMAQKAIAAAGGESVLPTEVDASRVPAAHVGELAEAHRLLMEALNGGGRQALPDSAANAQVQFECWLHEQTENHQPDHIAACKNGFWSALNAVQLALTPEPAPAAAPAPAPAPAPAEAAVFLIYFDFDRSDLRDDQQAVMDVVVAAAKAAPDRAIHIVAHTDTSGAVDYNQALSERRKNTVLGSLIDGDVSRGRISSEAVGETQPLVDTGDGVREQGNRVAVVTLY